LSVTTRKKRRRHQHKQLEEERGDQQLTEQAAIFVHRPEEPGNVELARKVGERGPPAVIRLSGN